MSSFRVPAAYRNDCLGEKDIISCISHNMYFVTLVFTNARDPNEIAEIFFINSKYSNSYWKKRILAIRDNTCT